MELLNGNVEHYTPPADHLKPFKHLNCTQPDCNSTFTNQSNFEMHLEKHHRVSVVGGSRSFNLRLYHCPELNCIYQFGKVDGKHFKTMKYLRQHYQKVHLAKSFVCEDCGKAFTLDSQLRKHKRDVCGKAFACRECGWPYESLEALLTHGKRKGHNVKEVITITKRDGKMPVNQKAGKYRSQTTAGTMEVVVDNKNKILKEDEINGNYLIFLILFSFKHHFSIYRQSTKSVGRNKSLSKSNVSRCTNRMFFRNDALPK